MRFYRYSSSDGVGLGIETAPSELRGVSAAELDPRLVANPLADGLEGLVRLGEFLSAGPSVDRDAVVFLPPIDRPGKVVCVGLNYASHTEESKLVQPEFPTLFLRASTTLVGHGQPLMAPADSNMFDYEGELAVIVGEGGRHIKRGAALRHVAGYSVFNDATARDWARRTSQWTAGKNFDDTGGFGPCLVTAEEVPPGAAGLRIETRVNDEVVQSAATDQMLVDVAELIECISCVMTLEAGDVISTGTPAGVGAARRPPRFLTPGDVCEVEVDGVGRLRNPVAPEPAQEHQ